MSTLDDATDAAEDGFLLARRLGIPVIVSRPPLTLTLDQVGDELHVKARLVREYIQHHGLKAIRFTEKGDLRVRWSDLEQWVKQRPSTKQQAYAVLRGGRGRV